MRRRWMLVIPAFATALLLAGCVSIPTSGDVQTEEIDSGSGEQQNVTLPDGPAAGQSMADLLLGFIRAGRGPQDNYAIAKEFLAPNTEWNGTDRVLVTSSQGAPVQVDPDTVGISVTVVGEVDAAGHYSEIPPQSQTLTYDFVEVDGEFRISRADPGTVLSVNGFANAFRSYSLYFFDQSFDYLVPDLRWFPSTPSVANRIVRELVAGPTAWLQGGVLFSAFPEGTIGRADYDAPEVVVKLSPEVRSESALAQRRMLMQLEASLDALGNISSFTVTAGELDLDPAPEVDFDFTYQVRDGVIGGLDGRFGTLTADGVAQLSTIQTAADDLQPTGASLGRDRAQVAILGPAGVTLVGESGTPTPIDSRAGLLPPSLDPHGVVWTIPRGPAAGLLVTGADGETAAPDLALDGEVLALEVSRDGARVLVALATANGPRVTVLGVQRDSEGMPVAFGAPYDLGVTGALVDVAWVDGTHVAVLAADGDGTQVEVLALGGPSQSLGEVVGAVQIVGGNLVAGIRVLLADGTVRRPSDAGGWRDTGLTASFLGTQQ